MPYKILLTILLLILPSFAFSEINYGIKGGVSINNQVATDEHLNIFLGSDVRDIFNSEFYRGQYGLFIATDIFPRLSIQPELFYAQRGSYHSLSSPEKIEIEIKLDYIEVPILVKYTIIPLGEKSGLNLFMGPYIAFNISSEKREKTLNGETNRELTNTKSLDYGLVLGMSAEFGLFDGRFIIDIRSNIGMAESMSRIEGSIPIYEEPSDPSIYNFSGSVLIGYMF